MRVLCCLLIAAIRKGVPLFNAGQDEACYDVYRLATLELLGRPVRYSLYSNACRGYW